MNPAPYPPQVPRPADIVHNGRTYRFNYTATRGREIWQAWVNVLHGVGNEAELIWEWECYACRWPSGRFTDLPDVQPEDWLLANTKEPTP